METIQVSIVVPVYNCAPYIDKCLQSIVDQTHHNLQIILVDDGSTDGATPQKCDVWSNRDSRINVIHQHNSGSASARNTGLHLASGEYLLFVDSDDFIEPDTVERLVTAGQDHHADLVIFGNTNELFVEENTYERLGANSCRPFVASSNKEFREHFTDLTENFLVIPPWNKLYSTHFLKKNDASFPEDSVGGEDMVFNLKLFPYAQHIVCMPTPPLYHYVKREGSLAGNTYNSKMLPSRIRSYEWVNQMLQSWAPDSVDWYANEFIKQIGLITETVYNSRKLTSSERKALISRILGTPVVRECCESTAPAGIRNKLLYTIIRIRSGILLTMYGRVMVLLKRVKKLMQKH